MSAQLTYNHSEILKKVAAGDEHAFALFVEQFVMKSWSAIQHLTGDAAVTTEILQEVCIKLWLHRDRLPEVDNLNAYIYRIAANEYYGYLRKEAAEHNRRQHWAFKGPAALRLNDEQEYNELQQTIQQIVNELPDQRKKVFKLSREAGMSIGEIAASLNLSPNTVKNTLIAALDAIRRQLKHHGYMLSSFSMLDVILSLFYK